MHPTDPRHPPQHDTSTPKDQIARSVLVVDDENGVRDLMTRWLQSRGYWVASASDATEALGLMEAAPPAVALCDIRMPGRDGLWLADRIRQRFPETAVIMATGVHDAVDAAASLGDGVVDYLTKPFARDRLQDAVVRGIQWHRAARDTRCWREKLEAEVAIRQARLAEAIGTIAGHSADPIEAVASIITKADEETHAHGVRVANLSQTVAQAMGVPADQARTIRCAALLHDLGKLAIPEALLRKPAPLSSEEQPIVRRYPEIGSQLIAALPNQQRVAAIVGAIQERPDGRGYPSGLGAGELSLGARIVAVVNAYDTMIHARVYRNALSSGQAVAELRQGCGSQFDGTVIAALERVLTQAA